MSQVVKASVQFLCPGWAYVPPQLFLTCLYLIPGTEPVARNMWPTSVLPPGGPELHPTLFGPGIQHLAQGLTQSGP